MSEYDKQAQDFITEHSLKIRLTFLGEQINKWDDQNYRPKYKVTITRKGGIGKKLTFTFWDSIANYEKGKEPSAYSILTCLSSDLNTPSTFEDFCSEFGYSDDSIKAKAIFRLCLKQTTKIRNFFTITELGELSSIQ
jgi:hypothetical protein